jgi:hypothetical protein
MSINTCTGSSNICPVMSVCAGPVSVSEKDIHRSQSAGSIASIGLDLDKRENKTGFQNAQGNDSMSDYNIRIST